MSEQTKPAVPVTVELSEGLSALANAKVIKAFERRLALALSGLLKQLGLSGEPSVEVGSSASASAVRVSVHETPQPYEPDLMKAVWLAAAPADARGAPDNPEAFIKSGAPDEWFTAYVADLFARKSDLTPVFEYLTHLVVEIIAERPACLVGPEQAIAYLKTASAQTPQVEPPLSQEEVSRLLKILLTLGVNVADQSLIWQTISVSRQTGRLLQDTAEAAFTQLRPPRIEIHAHPAYLSRFMKASLPSAEDNGLPSRLGAVLKFFTNVISTLGQQRAAGEPLPVYAERVAETIREHFRVVEVQLFNDLGLQLPELVWVASPKMQEGLFSIKINDRLTPPILGLQPDDLLVLASAKQLAELNVPGRAMTNLATGAECVVVSELHKEAIQQAGFIANDFSTFIPLALYAEIKRQAPRLLGVEDTEYYLAGLKQNFPTLVRVATARFSTEDLTRVLRGLLAEGKSIRNARGILEQLLQFNTVTAVSPDHISFDERLEL